MVLLIRKKPRITLMALIRKAFLTKTINLYSIAFIHDISVMRGQPIMLPGLSFQASVIHSPVFR